jgi:hypothetical protein
LRLPHIRFNFGSVSEFMMLGERGRNPTVRESAKTSPKPDARASASFATSSNIFFRHKI